MTKSYYNIEMWLTLPGAIAFYGFISLIGYTIFSLFRFSIHLEIILYIFLSSSFIVFYFILPETERRSLEDIEHHYSDNTKGMTDIHIRKKF